MKNAGLKKYSMELGGKSPVLILKTRTSSARWTPPCSPFSPSTANAATAGSRIFIQQSIYPEFVKRFAERANRLRVGDPTDPNTQIGALISQQHWEKVSGYIRSLKRGQPAGGRPGQTDRSACAPGRRQLPAPDRAGGCR